LSTNKTIENCEPQDHSDWSFDTSRYIKDHWSGVLWSTGKQPANAEGLALRTTVQRGPQIDELNSLLLHYSCQRYEQF
jgi:hypothetical protein